MNWGVKMLDNVNNEEFPFPKLPIYLFNSETRKKEVFLPLHDNNVKMYTCGPTVYDYAHIGNFRTYIFEDLLRRTLKFFGHQVTQVVNLTDVDDKTIRGAIENKQSLIDFTRPFKNAFFVDIQRLGIERAEYYPAATDYIPHMVDFIQKLLDKGIAYQSSDKSVYYAIEKFPKYGRLSHLKLNELRIGAGDMRIASDEYEKDNVADFVLWKAYDEIRDGHIFWESPFGKGRPGWHLECSTMAITLLGNTLDIHAGAVDNIFPHHENEIAQSEACSGKHFVRYWLHAEHLVVNHKKMSKSLGNFFTLRDLLDKGYAGMEIRYMLMHIHYRTQLNFTFEEMEAARHSLFRLNDFIFRMQEMADFSVKTSEKAQQFLKKAIAQFSRGMADDLNISIALASVFDLMYELNILQSKHELTAGDSAQTLRVLQEFNRVLGVLDFSQEESPSEELQDLLKKREEARKQKQWQLADALRDQIQTAGYLIEDTPQGARLKRK
jgi:cysteinyl-tRNA synthetase